MLEVVGLLIDLRDRDHLTPLIQTAEASNACGCAADACRYRHAIHLGHLLSSHIIDMGEVIVRGRVEQRKNAG